MTKAQKQRHRKKRARRLKPCNSLIPPSQRTQAVICTKGLITPDLLAQILEFSRNVSFPVRLRSGESSAATTPSPERCAFSFGTRPRSQEGEELLQKLVSELTMHLQQKGLLREGYCVRLMRGGEKHDLWLLRYAKGAMCYLHSDELTAPGFDTLVSPQDWLSFVVGIATHGEKLYISSTENICADPGAPLTPPVLTKEQMAFVHGEALADSEFIVFPSRNAHFTRPVTHPRLIMAGQFCILPVNVAG